ncbi:MAG: FAD-dependent oxidoreductase [Candidatus Acidiferrales bacterium]
MTKVDVTIVGAGPYGISAAAHLATIAGLDLLVFGEPMSFWESNMPKGMLLRSNWTATQIAHPYHALTLEDYVAACGNLLSQPVPVDRFIQYGRWYQERAVPRVDRRKVVRLDSRSSGFDVTLEDGEILRSRCVVVAAGIGSFAWCPPEFTRIPKPLASHTSEHGDLSTFCGKEVLVIGGGQSALESAALLSEAGAHVELIARSRRLYWLQGRASRMLHHGLGSFTRNLLYAPTDVGPAGLSQLLARPGLLGRVPRGIKNRLWRRAIRPAGARWLVRRLENVPIHLGRSVSSARANGDRVTVTLDDRSEFVADHVVLGTGYRIDIRRHTFVAPELVRSIRQVNGYPVLTSGLETSVSGLHIVGAPAAWSYGPLLQFVSGTRYASPALLRHFSRKPRPW